MVCEALTVWFLVGHTLSVCLMWSPFYPLVYKVGPSQ